MAWRDHGYNRDCGERDLRNTVDETGEQVLLRSELNYASQIL